MSITACEHDPNESVWTTVAELERKAYTKTEIAETLESVAQSLRDE